MCLTCRSPSSLSFPPSLPLLCPAPLFFTRKTSYYSHHQLITPAEKTCHRAHEDACLCLWQCRLPLTFPLPLPNYSPRRHNRGRQRLQRWARPCHQGRQRGRALDSWQNLLSLLLSARASTHHTHPSRSPQYPAWLWTLAEPPRSSRRLSPETEDYWKDARKKKNKANNVLRQQGAI
jgi:hypothetical protein